MPGGNSTIKNKAKILKFLLSSVITLDVGKLSNPNLRP